MATIICRLFAPFLKGDELAAQPEREETAVFARPFPTPEIALYPKQGDASGGNVMITHRVTIWAAGPGHFDACIGERVLARRTATPFRESAAALLAAGLVPLHRGFDGLSGRTRFPGQTALFS
jgi:hypothetical protein